MTKVVVRTDDVAGFFSRAKEAARRADRGESFEGIITYSSEGTQQIEASLSQFDGSTRDRTPDHPISN